MNRLTNKYGKALLLLLLLLISYYWLTQNTKYASRINFKDFHSLHNVSQIIKILLAKTGGTIFSSNDTAVIYNMSTIVNRTPSSSQDSNATLAVFIFHTQHFVLANLQLFLIRRLATNLIAIELFLDGSASEEMRQVAHSHQAGLHSFPSNMHEKNAGPSTRNANVVNWALATQGKDYLRNGTAILLLDGDVFPLTPFDSITLLNAHDLICRKHPATFARFCWIGFICLAPQLYSTIDDFNASPTMHRGQAYDSGGRTIEYLIKYSKTSFSWMKETILFENDKELFWGTIDNDITWIKTHFNRCDKCGPEIFFSAFNTSNAVFYHMISGTSEWRFADQISRRQSFSDSIMQSPYVSNRTNELNASVQKIQKMPLIPYYGNLTCANICHG
jgi:hypothetical protein